MEYYNEIVGDLLHLFDKGMFDGIGHGANCWCRMKSGIAGQISQKFPGAVAADNTTTPGDAMKLGTYTSWMHPKNGATLFNLYTQFNYGRDPDVLYLNYDALEQALRSMRANLSVRYGRTLEVGFPMIGCGLAHGDWNKVSEIIQRVFSGHCITVVKYGTPVEAKSEELW